VSLKHLEESARLLTKFTRKHYVYKQQHNMKVMNIICSELTLLCIAVHYQESIKSNVNICGLFLKFSSVEKIYVLTQ